MRLPRTTLLVAIALTVSVGCGDAGPEQESPDGGDESCTTVDTVFNCGACGVACATGEACVAGVCECDGGLSACSSGCVDVSADPQNCGVCGTVCGADELCSLGMCSPASSGCSLGLERCGGACVDTTTSLFHCGVCSSACSLGQTCEAGACVGPVPGSGGSGAGGSPAGGSGAGGGGTGGLGSGGEVGAGGASGGEAGIGGSAAGGDTGAGGAAGTGGSDGGGSTLAEEWPCDGTTAGYDAVVAGSGGSYTVNGSGNYSFQDAVVNALGTGGTSVNAKRKVLVQASGDISGAAQIRIRSNTVFNVCGTINVTNDVSGSDRSPAFARGASDIEIPHFNLTGSAQYGMFFREVSNLHLGDVHINGTGGLGIRIDSRQSDGTFVQANARNITIDFAHVENTGGHGVEFYGVDGIEIGTVEARNTGDSGLLLNYSINANIDLVDAIDAGGGTGYAAFRTANDNGMYPDGSYPLNIRLRELRASGSDSGRGFFCVTRSGGLEIETFNIDNVSGSPALFIENCHNVNIASAAGSGTLIGGTAHLGHNAGNGDASSVVTLQNISLQGGASVTSVAATCGRGNQAINVTGGSVNVCE